MFVRQWLIGFAFIVLGCAEAVDDQPTNLGTPPVTTPAKDSGTTSGKDTGSTKVDSATPPEDTGSPVDSSMPEDTTTPADTSVDPDTGVVDTALPDTYVPPVDTGGGGACMYCSTGTCATPLSDYSCLLNCLLDGYLDCDYNPAASMPCTCKL